MVNAKKHKHSDDHNDLNDDNIVYHDDDIRVHKKRWAFRDGQ